MPTNLESKFQENPFKNFSQKPKKIASKIRKSTMKNPDFKNLLKDTHAKDTFESYLDYFTSKHPKIKRTMTVPEMYYELGRKEKNEFLEGVEGEMIQRGEIDAEYLKKYAKSSKKGSSLRRIIKHSTKHLPFVGASTGYALLEHKYRKEIAKGLAGRLKENFNNKWWEYLIPGKQELAKDSAKSLLGEGALSAWNVVNGPLMYGLGAYAIYKTVKYLLKKRKGSKLTKKRLGELEEMRQDLVSKNHLLTQQMSLAA